MTIPADSGYYGNINIATLSGAFMNTTAQQENILQGFPKNVIADLKTVKVEDVNKQVYLTEGSNYIAEQSGIAFTLNNYTEHNYYITFNTVSNVTTNVNIKSIVLSNPISATYGGNSYTEQTGTYTSTYNHNITGNIYLTLPSGVSATNVVVVINGQVITSNDYTVIGNTVIINGYTINAGKTLTINVYYNNAAAVSGYTFLFKPVFLIFSVWVMFGFILLISLIPILYDYERLKHRKSDHAMRLLSVWMVLLMIWWIIEFAHLGGII
jgi:hypothetical protein